MQATECKANKCKAETSKAKTKLSNAKQAIMEILVIPFVKRVLPVPLQTLEQVLGQQRVLLVPLVRILCLQTLLRARPVTPLPTPPLSNAPLL